MSQLQTATSGVKLKSSIRPDAVQALNFFHLYFDVAWFGVAFGSTLSFLPIFAARLGASGWQLGLLTAGPALMSILLTLPAGRWLEARALGPAVTRTAFWHRLGLFCLVPLPLILPPSLQVWTVLLVTFFMAVPGTALAVGFNALLAATVPPEFRSQVVGRRNALLAGAIMVSFILSGWILDQLSFAWGYALVFAIGAVGSGLSTYHLSRIQAPETPEFQGRPLKDYAQPGRSIGFTGVAPQRLNVSLRLWFGRRLGMPALIAGIGRRYWWAMGAFFAFHLAQMLPAALFPIFWVREVHLTDGQVGWINGIFYLTMLISAPFLAPLTRRLGNYRLAAAGAALLSLYPLFTALSHGMALLIFTSIIGGMVWAILSGALVNRLLELTPPTSRPAHLAIYNLVLNLATLLGTMLGPVLADWTGLRAALLIIVVLRILSSLALARWG